MPSLIELLTAIDELPADESGAFVVDDGAAPLGSVFVEGTRVCWAAATGRSRRLRDLLRRYAPRTLDDADLDRAFAECRVAQRPLGEHLVARGLVSEDSLRVALKQHTVESLIAQCDHPDGQATWVGHRHRGYSPRFAFPAAELLAAAGAELYAAESAGVETDGVAAQVTGGAFAIGDDGEPVLVHATGGEGARVRALIELGAWATAALDIGNGFSAAVIERAVASASGPVALGWRSSRRLINAAILDSPAALARAVSELTRRRAPTVLTTRLPMFGGAPLEPHSASTP
ncbi:MAG: hypothetical protein K8W52_40305 [Deltaproteobacteria bacterium]|nr:hypothetical protein [Deltaproteobacteria bacterium]